MLLPRRPVATDNAIMGDDGKEDANLLHHAIVLRLHCPPQVGYHFLRRSELRTDELLREQSNGYWIHILLDVFHLALIPWLRLWTLIRIAHGEDVADFVAVRKMELSNEWLVCLTALKEHGGTAQATSAKP